MERLFVLVHLVRVLVIVGAVNLGIVFTVKRNIGSSSNARRPFSDSCVCSQFRVLFKMETKVYVSVV